MSTDTANPELDRSLRQRGAIIMALFALLWAMAGASGVASSGAADTVRILAMALTAVAVLLAVRSSSPATAQRPRRLPAGWYRSAGLVNIVQAVAIVVAVVVLVVAGTPAFVPPMVCLIVGAHFIPLSRLFDQPQYRWTGASLCVVAVAGLIILAVGAGAPTSRAVTGMGAAVVLWATSAHVAVRG